MLTASTAHFVAKRQQTVDFERDTAVKFHITSSDADARHAPKAHRGSRVGLGSVASTTEGAFCQRGTKSFGVETVFGAEVAEYVPPPLPKMAS